jgi:hypothetical protein
VNRTTNSPASNPIPFPRRDGIPSTLADKTDVLARATEIHGFCRDISSALQEIRHAVLNILYDTLERLDLDATTLVQVLDERPSIVASLMERDAETISTETILHHLEALRPYWQPD